MSDSGCRVLPYEAASGPHNMAADEALLESAASGIASLRFYGWSQPTLSLGYFQPEQLRRSDRLRAKLPFVRRATGGAALVHHLEVTYALALPAGPSWHAGESWPCRMHRIIITALGELGVRASALPCANELAFTGLLCFKHQTPGDLLIGSDKIVGSAQRRQRGALLQHGGILLARSPYAPELPGILELSGRNLPAEEVCKTVTAHFARDTGWNMTGAAWSAAERQRTAELAASKYANDAWNYKR
ncbi:MAG TPA: biotin/lipoate A/B protein ligase family protein [Gemmataceae bacterium]|nr:biotin/lipoate A/B protein ligase family protein [Gemmataceae bacterium]